MANFSKPQSMMTMLVALFVFLQVTVAFQHGSHHHAHPARAPDAVIEARIEETAAELEKRQSGSYIAITGVCGVNNDCNRRTAYPRVEIRQLKKNADQWNLYLLGLERFKAKSKDDMLSYYRIAGIHGRPYVSWGNFPTPLVHPAGFCPHGQVLFGSWHKPYLALFEQALYLCVREVISTFPANQQQRWANAAESLRMPYWDWAVRADGQTVPTLLRDQTVTVTKPSGPVTIPNPLYSYRFGDSLPSELGGGPVQNSVVTIRRPVDNPIRSNNNEVAAVLNNEQVSLRDRVFNLFASKADWGAASTAAIQVNTASGVDSFESIHDTVHNLVGGPTLYGGHMYQLEYSSFDPIFWTHHTNIDRLLAMYQLIVPNTYVANGPVTRDMAQWSVGEQKNAYTPLKPFTKDNQGNYFTSMDVRETRVLGYFYPETSDRTYSQVARAVTSLYGAGTRTLSKRATGDEALQYPGRPMKEGDDHHIVSITAEKFAIGGSYTVHCFVGKQGGNSTHGNSTAPYPISNSTVPYPISNSTSPYSNSTGGDASGDFSQDPNYVGAFGILSHSMGRDEGSSPVMIKGTVSLTSCLQGKEHYGELASLKPEVVEPYLAENFYYKVIGPGGVLNPDDIPNFHISVKHTTVQAVDEYGLPDLSAPYTVLPDATKDKPAGQPFTYTPDPMYAPLPEGSESEGPGYPGSNAPGSTGGNQPTSPANGGYSYPTMPWEEQGYCVTEQTIEYVDPSGNTVYGAM